MENSEKQLIINTTYCETRIALMNGGQLSELFIERAHEGGIVGNIFKGVVSRVLPGMNSAFVDIGLSKAAFLFGADIYTSSSNQNSTTAGPFKPDCPRNPVSPRLPTTNPQKLHRTPIEDLVQVGQEIIVQISKDSLGSKGPRVTTFLTLPGRYLVLMPYHEHLGISRRIESEDERERLRSIITPLLPEGMGVIVRTAATGTTATTIEKDLNFLLHTSKKLKQSVQASRAPSLLHSDLEVVQKVIRDLYSPGIAAMIVDDEATFSLLSNFLEASLPDARPKLQLYKGEIPLFDIYGIEVDIGRALGKRVELPSGGYLVIEQTEALTTFDVNTGKFVGSFNPQQTILRTNLEACSKIVDQLRLRNIGGIIILDFIDLESTENRELLYQTLLEKLKHDRARTHILKVSELGLVQMTRKRTSESLERKLLTTCPHCQGRGMVKSTETEGADLLREIIRLHLQSGTHKICVKVRSDIKAWLDRYENRSITYIKNRYHLQIQFELLPTTISNLRESPYEVSPI